jgi:predicted NAD-dependent protein-ADP-ribosyltransferase YbiA (DUF1768 family)
LSKLNSNINYPDIKSVNVTDLQKKRQLYKINIFNLDIIIAVGKILNTYDTRKIIYSPIYLVTDDKKVFQIGVYEIDIQDEDITLDKNESLDITKYNVAPLMYNFVNKDLLLSFRFDPNNTSILKNINDSVLIIENMDYKIPEERKDIFIALREIPIPPLLRTETKEVAKDITEKYKEDNADLWIQKFMKNKYYKLIDNDGSGDCLFLTIRDAFYSIAQQTSVSKLRKRLSNEATQEIFDEYYNFYNTYKENYEMDNQKIKDLKEEYTKIKEKFANTIDRNEKNSFLVLSSKVKKEHDSYVNKKKINKELLTEYDFMKGIDSLKKFKELILTSAFWAEQWSISMLEIMLNIKFIILSNESFKTGDLNNVLQCGHINDKMLKNKDFFTPEFYIILDYDGSHYKLIEYKKKRIFKFSEIPYDIKTLIVKGCMRKDSGIFNLIPDFKNFKNEIVSIRGGGDDKLIYQELSEAKLKGLYDDNIVFSFYEKSQNKLPGKGVGERIPGNMVTEFSELSLIANWRKKLDITWMQPFKIDGHTWPSVYHYFVANYFKNTNRDFYLQFTSDSQSEISKNIDLARASINKSGKLNNILVRPENVVIDNEYNDEKKRKILYTAQYAKFTQNDDLKKLLLETKNAKLQQSNKSKEADVLDDLMIIRYKIKEKEL